MTFFSQKSLKKFRKLFKGIVIMPGTTRFDGPGEFQDIEGIEAFLTEELERAYMDGVRMGAGKATDLIKKKIKSKT